MGTTEGQSLRTIENMFTVVDVLKDRNSAGVTELAETVDLSKSTVHSHLKTLEQLEYVVEDDGTYRLALRWLDIGGSVRKRHRLYEKSRSEADELARKTGELIAVTTYEYGKSVYLYQTRGDRALTMDSHAGVRFPLHCTASGKAILAYLPEDQVLHMIDKWGLPVRTENTYTDPEALFEELRQIRDQGVALEDEERIEGTRGIGVPIIQKNTEEVIGAIALCAPTTRLDDELFNEELPKQVAETGKVISINISFSE